MQIDTHVLLLMFHQGLLPSCTGWLGDPECALHTRFPSAEGVLAVHSRLGHHKPSTARRPPTRTTGPDHAKAAQRFFMTSVIECLLAVEERPITVAHNRAVSSGMPGPWLCLPVLLLAEALQLGAVDPPA